MRIGQDGRPGGGARHWRAVEGVVLFVLVPVVVAVVLPPSSMFPALFMFTGLGLWLLARTEGFSWRDLLRGRVSWRAVGVFGLVTALTATAVVLATEPAAFLFLPRNNPALMAMIVVLYPLLSALPQELIFRPLFFRRYGPLLSGPRAAVVLNAAAFSLAHLMYWSAIVCVMTFFGGLAFAWAYEIRRSFAMAVVLHAVAGWIVFAAGLGIFFYTGNITRPF